MKKVLSLMSIIALMAISLPCGVFAQNDEDSTGWNWKEFFQGKKGELSEYKDSVKAEAQAAREEEQALKQQIREARQSGDTETVQSLREQLNTVHKANIANLKTARNDYHDMKKGIRQEALDIHQETGQPLPRKYRNRVENVRDRREDYYDRRENYRDRREDYYDKKEDVRDRREDYRDRREDYYDRREDIRDKKDDVVKRNRMNNLQQARQEAYDAGDMDKVAQIDNRINKLGDNIKRDKREDIRDRRENKYDRREDVYDRKEDVRDRHEDRFDRREDWRDRNEDTRDRSENRFDRRKNRRDRHYTEHRNNRRRY